MAFSINHVTLVGNLTKDPELKYTPSGTPVCQFSVATNRSVKQEDGTYKDFPTFHRVLVWQKMAEFVSSKIQKGNKVYVDGRIENRTYEKKDGTIGYTSEIVAQNVIPMSNGQKAARQEEAPLEEPYVNANGEKFPPDDPTDAWDKPKQTKADNDTIILEEEA
jgi:single-strand DNA-binding protein